MIRKKSKSTKMIRKKSKSTKMIRNKTIHSPFGGHVPHVGKDCLKSKFRFKHMNTVWLDAGICNNCPEKPCKYFKAWKESLK